ncbi:MAG: YicC family protein [Verrucomicrobia bacterium]|nr:MAG: YicC family protein [Verrucomicrobiota bacterium]TAE88185.1 MAG: YicC family protein [Verrucomicrobiota bacterium]TAF26069.1 MAG: YicC family protein [Verrucomicrobiota bacterium]TAF41005.1 MAG: YicC family protein [Verrucomicrobiota bacterium]
MHSMTGFGRGSATTNDGTATVEITCVNRKQAEVVVQSARELNELEPQIRRNVLEHISRGRIQVSIQFERPGSEATPVRVDLKLVDALESAFHQISSHLQREVTPRASDFLRTPGIIRIEDRGIDPATAWHAIEPALQTAIAQVIEMRATEGRDLAQDLRTRLDLLEATAQAIATLAPGRPDRYRGQLLKRLRELDLELDAQDERVLRELAVFADRCDISEEITRLDSHFRKFRDYMSANEAAGRSLDFLCQEIHREFNTIGSKASDATLAQHVVTAKTELEKIREQVQNIE